MDGMADSKDDLFRALRPDEGPRPTEVFEDPDPTEPAEVLAQWQKMNADNPRPWVK